MSRELALTVRGGWSFNMPAVDLTIDICGMSGDGTIAAGLMLNEALSTAGFSLMAFDDGIKHTHLDQIACHAIHRILVR